MFPWSKSKQPNTQKLTGIVELKVRDISDEKLKNRTKDGWKSHPHTATSTKLIGLSHIPPVGATLSLDTSSTKLPPVTVIVRDVRYFEGKPTQIIADFTDRILCGYQMEEIGFKFWSFASPSRRNQIIRTPADSLLGF